jgi:hypothetical protein
VIIGLILLPIVITFHQRWTASLVQKLVVIVGFGAAVFAPLSFFPAVFTRYLMASFVAMGILWGLALAWLLPRRFAPLVLIAAIGLLLPKGSETWELVEWFGQEDTIALGTDWLRENTPQGARIAADGEANRFYLNRYAGYTGPLVYNITDLPVHETGMVDLQNQGIEYIVASTVASRDYYNEIVNSDNPDGPTVVAEIPSPTGTRGPGLLTTLPATRALLVARRCHPRRGVHNVPDSIPGLRFAAHRVAARLCARICAVLDVGRGYDHGLRR